MYSGCNVKFNHVITGTTIATQNASSVRECATIAANTEGGVSWTYRKSKRGTCNCNCVVRSSAGASESDNAEKISGGKECGEMSQEEWDQMNLESCDRKYDRGVKYVQGLGAGEDAENIESQEACAQLAVNRPDANFWVYNKNAETCALKKSYISELVYPGGDGRVLGNVACGLMSKEHWALLTNCTLEYDIGSDAEVIEHQIVESLQDCARLTESTSGGLYWTYIKATGLCNVKNSDDSKHASSGNRKVSGYRECALLSDDEWSQREKSRVKSILRTPIVCPENHVDKEETGSTKQKTTPIIDLFLNPARSEELKDRLRQSEMRTTSVTHTKVINCNLKHFYSSFRKSFLERFPTCSVCFGSPPCPATPPEPHQSQVTCFESVGGWESR